MDHLDPFQPRRVVVQPSISQRGWRLKQYAILAEGRMLDRAVTTAAATYALQSLPPASDIEDPVENHGVGFQIVHLAQVAIVAPLFYWQWGSVLFNAPQARAPLDAPTKFGPGVSGVVGCVWEMNIVCHEVTAWRRNVLDGRGDNEDRLEAYINHHFT